MMRGSAIPFARAAALTLLAALGPTSACAQAYPSRPIKIEAGFPAATTVDIVARTVAQKLNEAWGQPAIVENRPGAAGNVAAELVVKSPPDGYTLLLANNGLVIGAVSGKVPYHAQTDLKAVAHVASGPHVLIVTPTLPVNSVQQLIALARSRPGEISFASVGVGSPSHLASELFKSITHVDIRHIPYKGSGQVLVDIATGDVMMSFSGLAPSLPMIQQHRVKALGVSTAARSSALPNVPTFREAGLSDFEVSFWYGVFAPAKTPNEIVAKLNGEIARALKSPDVRNQFSRRGLEVVGGSAADFDTFIKNQIARWTYVVKTNGLVLEQ